VSTVADLFASTTPCQRCLEWVVEQGQLASRRLSDLQARKLDDLYLEKVNHKEPT
jgi:hypothetical protein